MDALMRRLCLLTAVVVALIALAPASRVGADAAGEHTVILLSWDGVRHDYLGRGNLPALERVAREGVRAEALVPAFPSLTFPSHVTLATGASADRHGIVANRFHDPERGEFDYSNQADWIEAEPLWVTAERQGIRSAVFFWVGSETDWRGRGASFRKSPFDSSIGELEKVKQILQWLDLPAGERPQLVMSWWHGADHAGHRYGPDAEETTEALRTQDRALGRLLRALDKRHAWSTTTLVIVSDHGMTSVQREVDLRTVLHDAGVGARVVSSSAFAHLFLKEPSSAQAAVAAFTGLRDLHAYPRAGLPPAYRYAHPTRTGDVVVVADPPTLIARGSGKSGGGLIASLHRLLGPLGRARGAHGYDPIANRDMHGIFLAMGRAVPAGLRLPAARTIDVAPTVAALLGIDPPASAEGRSLTPFGSSLR